MERAILRPEGTILKHPARSPIPPLALDRGTGRPLHRQLAAALRRAIASGALADRLPSTRALARDLGLSRNTVVAAYEALTLEGVLTARTGSGTWRAAPAAGVLKRADLLRGSHYPFRARQIQDPDGNPIHIHR